MTLLQENQYGVGGQPFSLTAKEFDNAFSNFGEMDAFPEFDMYENVALLEYHENLLQSPYISTEFYEHLPHLNFDSFFPMLPITSRLSLDNPLFVTRLYSVLSMSKPFDFSNNILYQLFLDSKSLFFDQRYLYKFFVQHHTFNYNHYFFPTFKFFVNYLRIPNFYSMHYPNTVFDHIWYVKNQIAELYDLSEIYNEPLEDFCGSIFFKEDRKYIFYSPFYLFNSN